MQTSPTLTGPGAVTATATDGTATSTTTAVLTANSFAFTFTQMFPDNDQTSGSGNVEFLASAGDQYMITDPRPVRTDPTSDSIFTWDANLMDVLTSTVLYDTHNGGSVTGALTSGDLYEFSVTTSVFTLGLDPTFMYAPSLTITPGTATPENPAPLIPVVLVGLAWLRRRRRTVR